MHTYFGPIFKVFLSIGYCVYTQTMAILNNDKITNTLFERYLKSIVVLHQLCYLKHLNRKSWTFGLWLPVFLTWHNYKVLGYNCSVSLKNKFMQQFLHCSFVCNCLRKHSDTLVGCRTWDLKVKGLNPVQDKIFLRYLYWSILCKYWLRTKEVVTESDESKF